MAKLELRMDTLESKLDRIMELLEKKVTENNQQVYIRMCSKVYTVFNGSTKRTCIPLPLLYIHVHVRFS